MARIKIDPLTRIEGHLRIEAEVDGGRVSRAWSSGTMFRGIEKIVEKRDPREAWIWTQRICGVCTTVHAFASVRAVEDALGIQVPDNARIIRNLIAGAQLVQDHVIHFYHLQALDWVDVTSALRADPAETARLANSLSDWPMSGTSYFRSVQQKVQALVNSGQLSLFASGYWGHPAYRLPPAVNLLAVAHYLEALDWQRDIIRIHATLGGKNPHLQTFLVGGVATSMDPDQPTATLNPERLDFLGQIIESIPAFVNQVYVPDVLAVAGFYRDWLGHGEGTHNFLSYGAFPESNVRDPSRYFLPPGVIVDRNLGAVSPVSMDKVTEYVTHSWYRYEQGDDVALNPYDGETQPNYTGPTPPFEFLDTDAKYSWLKAPRYEDRPMEVGPLARMLIAYASGQEQVKQAVDSALSQLGVPATSLFSTLGRIAARAIETKVVAAQLSVWLGQLRNNLERGELEVHAGEMWDPKTWPNVARGVGTMEAPRGSLAHWVQIEDRRIKRYQAVVPSTWNGSPRDAKGQPGPYEAALTGTPVADQARPLEILRTVHSFDPCLACAVHVLDPRGGPAIQVSVRR